MSLKTLFWKWMFVKTDFSFTSFMNYLFPVVPNPISVRPQHDHDITTKTTVSITGVDISWRFTKTTILQPNRWVRVRVATPLHRPLHSSAAGVGEKRRMGRTSNGKTAARAIHYAARSDNVERPITEEMYDDGEYLILINETRRGVVGLRPLTIRGSTMEMRSGLVEGSGWMWRRSLVQIQNSVQKSTWKA